ncbi:ABC transporter substrate-binding protein [Cohnella abietis]|uniref:ABC transporter substrate-binding protein n=1 Tax=Cohnella abietis TaxID=2507935 RepID=A0A3T1D1K2_9BACL|nr:ABC transporter substrate-binding protein [Cohnella abietis]BBI31885.1 ABC transporter substrate-binding protein [Cohnella abietis]
MKKQFVIILSLVVILGVILSGCGDSKNNNASSPAASPAESSTSPSSSEEPSDSVKLDPYKLVMVYPGGNPKDLKLVEEEMSKYLTEKINATIELKPIDWGAWADKSNLMFTSNDKFDLIFTAAWLQYNSNVAKGQFLELDKLIDQYGQGAKETLGPDWIKGSQVNGHNYGLPTLKEFAGAAGLLFRKDLVEKYNIDLNAINTMDDLTPIFQTIKDKEPGVTPLVQSLSLNLPGLISGYSLDYLGDSYGVVDPDSGDLKVVNMFETKKYTDAVQQMRKWNKAGFINKDASTIKDDQLYNVMKAGKGFAFAASTKPGKNAEMSTQLGVDLLQKDLIKPQTTTSEASGAMLAISRTSGNPERAMMFLNLLYTDQYLINLLDFGIEGKHYVKSADNVLDFPEGVTAQTSGYNPGAAWMFGNQLNTYLWSNEDPNKWNKFKEFNDSSTKSLALGFVWDPTNVKNEVAAVANARTEFSGAIQTGTIDPDKFLPQFNQKLKDAGLDKIIEEKQKQLDAWAQNK